MIVDFRLRPPVKGFRRMVMYANAPRRDRVTRIHGFEPAPSAARMSMPRLLAEMDAAGVTLGVVVGRYSALYGSVTNEDVLDIVARYPGRFAGIASIDPTDRRRAIAQIERATKAGLKGVNIEPGSYEQPMYADDRRLYPIYAHCEDAGLPVLVMAGGSAGPDLSYTHPQHIDRVAADFPDLKIAITHGAWPWTSEILHVAFRRANVYLSPDQYLANLPGSADYVKAADGFLADRFLYASSYPFTPVKEYAQWFRRLPIRPEAMDKVLWRNADRLLGLGLAKRRGVQ